MSNANKLITPAKDKTLTARECLQPFVGYDLIAGVYLSQIVYWHTTVNRKFYKTDVQFAAELHISVKKFRRIKKTIIEPLPFITITNERNPCTSHYSLDLSMLNASILKNTRKKEKLLASDTPPEIAALPKKNQDKTCQKGQTGLPQKGQTGLPQKGQTITESKTEITSKITKTTTTEKPVVVNEDKDKNQNLDTQAQDDQGKRI